MTFPLSRRGFLASSAAAVGTAIVPVKGANAKWKSPLIRQSDYMLIVSHIPSYEPWDRVRVVLASVDTLPFSNVRSAAHAEDRLFLQAPTIEPPCLESLSPYRFILMGNRVAVKSLRGRGNMFFAAASTWTQLGLQPSSYPAVGRWHRYRSPFELQSHPFDQFTLYGTFDPIPIGADILCAYRGSGDFDAPAVFQKRDGKQVLVMNPGSENYMVRCAAPLHPLRRPETQENVARASPGSIDEMPWMIQR